VNSLLQVDVESGKGRNKTTETFYFTVKEFEADGAVMNIFLDEPMNIFLSPMLFGGGTVSETRLGFDVNEILHVLTVSFRHSLIVFINTHTFIFKIEPNLSKYSKNPSPTLTSSL